MGGGYSRGYDLRRMLALTDVSATIGLVLIFLVIFPILANVLIVFAVAQALGERAENQRYRRRTRS
jgi:hypothetical protein